MSNINTHESFNRQSVSNFGEKQLTSASEWFRNMAWILYYPSPWMSHLNKATMKNMKSKPADSRYE